MCYHNNKTIVKIGETLKINKYINIFKHSIWKSPDRLCGLVVRVSGYESICTVFDSRPYQIFWEVMGLERGPLSLVRTVKELIEW
jgi:hypothetical protein